MANITENVTLTRTDGTPTNFQFNLGARGFQPPADVTDSGGTTITGEAGDLIITADNVAFTAEDCVIYITGTGQSGLRTLNQDDLSNSSFNLSNCVIDMNDVEAFQQVRCNVNATDVTFYQDGNATNWGNFTGVATTFNLNNVRFWGYSFFPNFANLAAGSVLNNLSFYNGDATDPLGAYLEAGQMQSYVNPTFGPVTRARSAFGGGTGVAIMRINNQNNRGTGTSAGWTPYAQIDLRAVPLAGDAQSDNSNRTCISIDRNVGMWIINPLLPDFTGVTNSLQLVGTAGNTDRRPTNVEPASVTVAQAWNPRVVATGTTTEIPDVKIRFDQNHFMMRDNYTYGSAPSEQGPAVRTAAEVTADNGYLFNAQFQNFDSANSAAYDDPVGSANATLVTSIPNRTGRFYSLTHGVGNEIGREWTLVYPAAGQPLTDDVDTIDTFSADGITWSSTSDYPLQLDTYYTLGTNQATVDNLANIYPSLKTSFYNNEGDFDGGIGALGSGDNTITFSRATTFDVSTTHSVGATSNTVNIAPTMTAAGVIDSIGTDGVDMTVNAGSWPAMTWFGINLGAVALNGSSVTLSSGSTLRGSFTGLVEAHINTGQTFVRGSTFDIDENQAGFDILDATVEGVAGNVTIQKTNGNAITIRVPADLMAPTGNIVAGTGVTLAALPAAQFARTVTTPAQNGTFGVVRITGTVETVVPAERTTTSAGGSYTIPAGDTDTYRFYWKQDNTPFVSAVDPGQGFFTTIIERSNVGLTVNTEETMEATEIFSLLYSGDAGIGRINTVVDGASGTVAGTNQGIQIQINNPDTNVSTTAGASQYQVLSAMDTVRYMQAMLDTRQSVDLISPPSSGSVTMNARYVQLNTANAGQQQRLVGAEFNSLQNFQQEDLTRTIYEASTNGATPTTANWRILTSGGTQLQANAAWPNNNGSVLEIREPDGQGDLGRELRERVARREASGELLGVGGRIRILNSSQQVLFEGNYSNTTVVSDSVIQLSLTTRISSQLGLPADGSTNALEGYSLTGPQVDQIVQLTGTVTGGGSLSVNSVNILPNPAGATPTQIQDAATAAITNTGVVTAANAAETAANTAATHAEAASTAATSNLAVSMDSQNAVGYILGTDGDTRLLGIKPRSGNYNANTNYRGNVTGE